MSLCDIHCWFVMQICEEMAGESLYKLIDWS